MSFKYMSHWVRWNWGDTLTKTMKELDNPDWRINSNIWVRVSDEDIQKQLRPREWSVNCLGEARVLLPLVKESPPLTP